MAKNRLKIDILGHIGKVYDWSTGEVIGASFEDVRREIKEFKGNKIDIYINSEGGSVLEAESIYSVLVGHRAFVTAHIIGYTISSATIITLAADKVIMAENAWFMIHNPTNGIYGDVNDMRKNMNLLEAFTDKLARLYSEKMNQAIDQVRSWMDEEKWFTADEALDAGLVDETSKGINVAAFLKKDGPQFKNTPEAVKKLLIQNNQEMKFEDFKNWVKNSLGITVSDKATTIEEAQSEVDAAMKQGGDKGTSISAVKNVLKEYDTQVSAAIKTQIENALKPVTKELGEVKAENLKLTETIKAMKAEKAGGAGAGDGNGDGGGKKIDAKKEGENTVVSATWWDDKL